MIGGGNMAEAIVRAAIASGTLEPGAIVVSDPVAERRELFASLGVTAVETNAEAIGDARQVMLAIKPQMLDGIAADLAGIDRENQIVLSIMAGITCAKIEAAVGGAHPGAHPGAGRVIRVMPNTPLLVGEGMSAIAIGANAHEGDELLALQIFRAGGEAIVVDESLMDAVTAVSGSGPAYVFYLAEAMADAGEALGLSAEHATLLTQQTIAGAAKLLAESDDTPGDLRRKVTSPGGTTQAACEHLDASEVKRHISDALAKAAARSKELGG